MPLPGVVARHLAATLVTAGVTLSSVSGALAATPAPRPPELPEIARETLPGIYADNRDYIEAAATMAEVDGHQERAATLRRMAQPGRRFLSFDARGGGRAVEVIGDLERAEKISILVPGSDMSLDAFDGQESSSAALGASARALYKRSKEISSRRVAVVAWLGYEAPDTFSLAILTTERAEEGARALREFVGALQEVNDAPVALMCHSYGSVVCGRAAPGLEVSDIAVYGSPGMGVESAEDLENEARVWAARGGDDWISRMPNYSVSILGTTMGFGDDPTDPAFGALAFPAGDGGHSDYLKPGGPALDRLAHIASGDIAGVVAGG